MSISTQANSKSFIAAIPGDGLAVATVSTETMFSTLRVRRFGPLVELTTELSLFSGRANRWLAEAIGHEIFDDEEDAVSVAVDMERAAIRRMAELGGGDIVDDGGPDFQDALISYLDRAAQYAVAAE
jgi:hypothetical protein